MTKFNEQISGEKLVLVEFFATWCPHCQRMAPRMEELKRRMADKLKVAQLDIDSHETQETVRHFSVNSTPTFILFKDGKQLWRESGEYEVDDLIAVLEKYM